MPRLLLLLLLVPFTIIFAKDDPVTFKSDVSLARVDAQAVDRDGRAITGLRREDFVLRVNGRVVPIRNFASEEMPIDVLLLLDVSGSMEPHVERIASAAQQALNVLADRDRVAIMVFDTSTRVRLPFRSSHSDVTTELRHLIRSEGFDGGTRITHAMLEAASYLQKEARPEARHAIVILTDDQTQDEENEPHVEAALARANAVLSFLQAPYEPPQIYGGGGRRPHGTWGSGGGGEWPGGGWPGSGGGIGFPGSGPIILGRRGSGGYGGGDRSHTAGTAEIARDSGGDTMQVDEASALEDTLARLRQRYALFYNLPEGLSSADQASVEVELASQARIRYDQAELRYRRVYMAGNTSGDPSGPVVTRVQAPADTSTEPERSTSDERPTLKHRRVAVNDDSGAVVNTVTIESDNSNQQTNSPSAASPSTATTPSKSNPVKRGGWPRANSSDTPQ